MWAARPQVTTLIGTGAPGYSDREVNNPYGLAIGPDRAFYFCDLDNQRVRRLDLGTRKTSTIAGNGQKAYAGDGGKATDASLSMPHEIQFDAAGHLYIAERDSHVIRKVDGRSGVISTLAGTGVPGFSGDDGPAAQAQLRSPHSIAVEPGGRRVLICDIGNHRLRAVDLQTLTIRTIGGTGDREPTPDGARLEGTPLNGPRTMAFDGDGNLFLALREGNAIYRVAAATGTSITLRARRAGLLRGRRTGPSGDAGRPEGARLGHGALYIVDTENHVIRRVDLRNGVITTVLGTGKKGDGPEPEPLRCALARPHGVLVDAKGVIYVGDSEAHRIRMLA